MFHKLKDYLRLAIIGLSLLPNFVLAGEDPDTSGGFTAPPSYKLRQLGEGYLGFADKSPGAIVGAIISGLLALLGVIFLVLMVYAGFLWMTAQGDEKKVETARTTIKNSIIGLALVLAAYGITKLILGILLKTV